MNDIQKMFQTIINNQSAFRQEISKQLKELENRLTKKIDSVAKDVKVLTKRIDNLGMNQAYLEDDIPTREEFESLEKRVDKIEQKTIIT